LRAVDIIAEYRKKKDIYEMLTEAVEKKLGSLLSGQEDINVHSISARTKSVESLAEKVRRPEKQYSCLADIKDLTAVRVVTYFSDEIDLVDNVIENNLIIDSEHSIDKRDSFDYHEFGYSSLHKIAALPGDELCEGCGEELADRQFEIQIRTILQHAWAEIEHDLGYKYKEEIPDNINRRFARLSALLEVADDEFLSLREDLDSYEDEIQQEIRQNPGSLEINKLTLEQFMEVNASMQRLTSYIDIWSENLPRKTTGKDFFLGDAVQGMRLIGMDTLNELEELLTRYEPLIRESFDLVFARDKALPGWSPSMILFALVLIYGAVNYSAGRLQDFYDRLGFRPGPQFKEEVRQRAEDLL